MTELCRIFKDFGDLNGEHYDIYQMWKTLKLKNWPQIVPFEYYLTPLKMAVKKVRDCLSKMEKDGPLLCRYIIEHNDELMKLTHTMVKTDQKCQWLVGDPLKQDQFNFFYECCKIVYDSAVKEQFLAEDKVVMESVVPKIIAFKSLMAMREIQFKKADELAKVKEKKAKNEAFLKANPKRAVPKKREASKSKSPGKEKSPKKKGEKSKSKSPGKKKKDEEEEEVVEEKDPLTMTEDEIYLKRLSGEEDLSLLSDDQRKHRLEEIERKKFGRY